MIIGECTEGFAKYFISELDPKDDIFIVSYGGRVRFSDSSIFIKSSLALLRGRKNHGEISF